MPNRISEPVSFLPSFDDDDSDDDSFDSSHSTPRTSFLCFIDPPEPRLSKTLRRRPHSLFSIDSGYFSIMSKDSPLSRSFSHKTSGAELRLPLAPISGSTEATQESPKREGVIRSFLRKKKKSFTSASPSDIDPFTLGIPHRSSADDLTPRLHPPPSNSPSRSTARDPSVDAFEEQDRFVVRRGMKHHPYSREDAPYMLAYDRTLLDNDKYFEILLRRLNHNHSPSFHDFSQASPRTILDLGCGSGGWAVEAAEFWPSSQVIGFDLVDPARLRGGTGSPSNLQWKQGNFVKYKLPFPKNMFDLVRMSNLSLCIPQDRWEHILSEVRRVLAHGGHLELIDDYLYFPYSKHPPQPLEDSHDVPHIRPTFSSSDKADEEHADADRRHSVGDNDGDDDDDEDDFVSTKSRLSSLVDTDEIPPSPAYDPVSEWKRNVDNSKTIEKLFEDMLSRKFSIHPHPSKFFNNVIDKVFGRYNQCRLHEFNLYLAPPSTQDSDVSSVGSSEGHSSASLKKAGKDFAKWVAHVEWDLNKEKEKKLRVKGDRSSEESLPSLSSVPDMLSVKTTGRLRIKPPAQPSHSTQSPGLILWPSTFIPMSPFELEMHACKHLHSLIGCKAALTEFLQDIAQERNLPFDQQMLDDLIWEYESFRRKRFHWPSECPDSHSDITDPLTTTPRSNTPHNSVDSPVQARPHSGSGGMSPPTDPLFPREKLDFVRSIRVYSATKNDEEAHVS